MVRGDLCRGHLTVRNRRQGDRFRPVGLGGRKTLQDYFVDRYSSGTLCLVLLLLAFSTADAIMTLQLIDLGGQELNPVMGFLLGRGLSQFLLGKYVLTAAGVPVLLLFKNHRLFGTRFRAGNLIPVFVAMYGVLFGYQVYLLLSTPAAYVRL